MNRFALGSGRIRVATILSIALTLFAGAQAKSADIDIFSNYSANPADINASSAAFVGYQNATDNDLYQASGFRVGATSWNLTSVDVVLEQMGNGTGDIVMELWSGDGGTPSNPLAPIGAVSFTTPTITTLGWYNFVINTPYTLATNTDYYIVMYATNPGVDQGVDWHYMLNPPGSPTQQNASGVTLIDTTPGEVNQRFMNGANGTWTEQSSGRSGLRLNATPVPEPSTYALGAIGVLTLGIVAKRRKRANA